MNSEIGICYYLAQDYKSYSFTLKPDQLSDASKFALRVIDLNRSVFGTTQYKITDTRLFSSDTIDNKIISIELADSAREQNVNSTTNNITCSITITTTTSCRNASNPHSNPCTTTITSTMWCDNEWPGGGNPFPGGGGGGGGGDIPPAFPCFLNPSYTGQTNNISNSLWPDGPPRPCPPTGTGWIPAPQGATNLYGYYYSRLAQLDSMLSINPYAVEPCDSLEILNSFGQMFQSVGNFQVPISILNRLDSIKNAVPNFDTSHLFIQNLNDAASSVVNCDFVPVKILQLPINIATGNRFTTSEFLEFFRKNLNLFATPGVIFTPYNFDGFDDAIKYNSDTINSIGAIVHIEMFPNNGSVIMSGYQNQYLPSNYISHNFTFSTLVTPKDDFHPVSGNRKFGIYTDNSGGYTFYTMGVDRISLNIFVAGSNFFDLFGNSGFEDADLLWTGMQTNMINYINSNGGSAQNYSRTNYIVRPKYEDIDKFLKGLITYQQLKDILCP